MGLFFWDSSNDSIKTDYFPPLFGLLGVYPRKLCFDIDIETCDKASFKELRTLLYHHNINEIALRLMIKRTNEHDILLSEETNNHYAQTLGALIKTLPELKAVYIHVPSPTKCYSDDPTCDHEPIVNFMKNENERFINLMKKELETSPGQPKLIISDKVDFCLGVDTLDGLKPQAYENRSSQWQNVYRIISNLPLLGFIPKFINWIVYLLKGDTLGSQFDQYLQSVDKVIQTSEEDASRNVQMKRLEAAERKKWLNDSYNEKRLQTQQTEEVSSPSSSPTCRRDYSPKQFFDNDPSIGLTENSPSAQP
jgi:hypothetical protein